MGTVEYGTPTKTAFELEIAYDVGDGESGPLVRTAETFFEATVNLFKPMTDLFAEVQALAEKEFSDHIGYVGLSVKRLVPDREYKQYLEELEAERRDMERFGMI